MISCRYYPAGECIGMVKKLDKPAGSGPANRAVNVILFQHVIQALKGKNG